MGLGYRLCICTLALVGLIGVLPVGFAQLTERAVCPHLGPVPACYVVTLAYLSVLISAINRRNWKPSLFFCGWIPLFLLAATGTGFELFNGSTCPRTGSGLPKCYLSLALAFGMFIVMLSGWLSAKRKTTVWQTLCAEPDHKKGAGT